MTLATFVQILAGVAVLTATHLTLKTRNNNGDPQ